MSVSAALAWPSKILMSWLMALLVGAGPGSSPFNVAHRAPEAHRMASDVVTVGCVRRLFLKKTV